MPIIDHSIQPIPQPTEKNSVRTLVGSKHGAESLTVNEMVLNPGVEGRLHTHTADQAIMVMEGSVQMIVGEEVETVRSGHTLLAPPGVPHKLVNNTWVPARMLVIFPTISLETSYIE